MRTEQKLREEQKEKTAAKRPYYNGELDGNYWQWHYWKKQKNYNYLFI